MDGVDSDDDYDFFSEVNNLYSCYLGYYCIACPLLDHLRCYVVHTTMFSDLMLQFEVNFENVTKNP